MDIKDNITQPCTSRSSLPPFSSLTASRSRAAVIHPYTPHLQGYTTSYQPQLSAPLGFDVVTSNAAEHPQLTSYHHQVFFDGQGPYYHQHLASGLVQPPVTDMSLGLPYSSNQPIYLTSPHHPVDMLNCAGPLPSSTDHPPQIPLSQVESFLSAAEQKPPPDFMHAQPQHWDNSYRPSASDHLTPPDSFSPLYSKSSETLTDAMDIITSIGQSKTNGSFEGQFYSPKTSVGFNMLSEFSAYIGSSSTLSGGVHADNPNYHFTSDAGKTLLKSSDFSPFRQQGRDGTANQNIPGYTNFQPSIGGSDHCNSNLGSKYKKKKKSLDHLDNVNISGHPKAAKKRTKKLKKLSALDFSHPDNMESTSPGPCLSPTFIASLSSKRADVFRPSDCSTPYNGGQHENHVSATIKHSKPNNCNNQTSQVPNDVPGNFQQAHSKKRCQNANLATNSNSKVAREPLQVSPKHKYSNALTVEVRDEDKSPSPYQFSPDFLASLSSKKAEMTLQSNSASALTCQNNFSMLLPSVKGSYDNSVHVAAETSSTFHCPDPSVKSPSPDPISPGFLASLSSKRVKPSVKSQYSAPNQSMLDIYLPNNHMQERVISKSPFDMTVSSPKPYRSPPVYNTSSGFQYPTPPMEDEDVKGPSPSQGLSPPLLPSSRHSATNSSGQSLSPTFDDALPTPPNSAGPKPSDTLSKEEQTSRILEIIAREREKVANAPPVPIQDTKKKKKKRRLKETGESNSPLLSTNAESYGGEMNFQFHPKFPAMASNGCLSLPNDSSPRNFPHNIFHGSDKLGSDNVLNYENGRHDFSPGGKQPLDYLAVRVNQNVVNKNQPPFSNGQMNQINGQHHSINTPQQLLNGQHQYIQQLADNGQQPINKFQQQTSTSLYHENNSLRQANYSQQHVDNSQQHVDNSQLHVNKCQQQHFDNSQPQNNWQHTNNNQQHIDHNQQQGSNNEQIDYNQQHSSNNQQIDHNQQVCSNNQQVNNIRSEALPSHCDTSNTTPLPISSTSGPNQYQQSFCKTSSSYSMNQLLLKRPPIGTTDQSLGQLSVNDPYAFDEPEHGVEHTQLKKEKIAPTRRQLLTISSQVSNMGMQGDSANLLKTEKPSPSVPILTHQALLTSIPVGKVVLSPSSIPINHLQCRSLQASKTVAPGSYFKKEPQQIYRKCGQSLPDNFQNQVFSKLTNGAENESLKNPTYHPNLKPNEFTYDPAVTYVKQEFPDVIHPGDDCQGPVSDVSSNFHMQDVKKCEVKQESGSTVSAKKKRGRPSKFMDSEMSPDIKPKTLKHKLQDKKTNSSPTSKLQYRINGVSARPDDLKLDQNLVERLANNLMEVADCSCLSPDHIPSESLEGPYYTQLGAARDIPAVRKIMEHRTGVSGAALRIEKVIFTGKEGKSKEGCPVAKWIIRRSGPEEKYLCIVRKRPGHFCDTAVIIVVIVAWEGVMAQQADSLYDFLITTLPKSGLETDRRCGLNEKKTCACQGVDLLRRGASFSFGCSWSMYYNGCKFARSQSARKFKLKDFALEDVLSEKLEKLATDVSPLYSRLAPDAFRNQTQFESQAGECRLGSQPGRPFSGVTAVVDFCCHSHRDCHNMNNGSTVVVNLTKHRGFEKPDDEQYHVLPLYILDQTDELGSMDGQMEKVRQGSLEVLSRYMTQVRMRSTPYRPCQRNRTTPKKQGLKKGTKKPRLVKAMSFPPGNYEGGESPGSDRYNDGFCSPQIFPSDKPGIKEDSATPGVGIEARDQESMSYTDLMAHQGAPGFNDLYTKFWDYFYTHGVFPPRKWTTDNKAPTSLTVVKTVNLSPQGRPNTVIQPSSADQMFLHQQQLSQRHATQQHDVLQTSDGQQPQHRQQVPTQGHQTASVPPSSSPRQQKQVSLACYSSSQASLAEPHQIPCLSQASHQTSQHHSVSHVQHPAYHSKHPSSSSQASSQNSLHPQHNSYTLSLGAQHISSLGTEHTSSLGLQHSTSLGPQQNLNNGPPRPCKENKLFFNFESPQQSLINNSSPENDSHSTGQVSSTDHLTRPPPPYTQAVVQSQDMQIKSQVTSAQVPQCPPPSYKDSVAFGLPNHRTGQVSSSPNHPHGQTFCQSSPSPDSQFASQPINSGNYNINIIRGHQRPHSLLVQSFSSPEGPGVPLGAHSNSLPSPENFRSTASMLPVHSGKVEIHPNSLTGQLDSNNRPSSRMSDTIKSPDDPIQADGRCWSRMSEPLHESENTRPFSRMSEPDLAHIAHPDFNHYLYKKKHIVDPTPQVLGFINDASSNHSFRLNKVDKESIPVVSNQRRMEIFRSQEPMEQSANLPLTTYRQSDNFGILYHTPPDKNELSSQNKIINTLMGQKAQLSSPTLVGQSAPLTSPRMTGLNDLDPSVFNPSQGNIYPNGPMPGEKVKVHKSEGFVVPTLGQGPREPPYQVIDSTIISVETDDNKEVFEDPAMGGVAIALCHGAVLFEVAKRELHATTALKEPNRYQPKRISLVFYQHKNLNLARHGFEEYERKTEERRSLAEQARLIEEMETNGFLKGELSELASFPNLTKGTFGKVFNFPEAKETLFPLRFPRYLDSSPLEQITPVMFACMSIAFPKYIKEAFPNPSSLPRLMNGHMPVKMASSLSDRRTTGTIANAQLEDKNLKFIMETLEDCGDSRRSLPCTWNPNIPLGHMATSNSIITRWVHDETSVTGPYNKWVELAGPENHRDDAEEASEADLKEKMFESLSQLDKQVFLGDSDFQMTDISCAEHNYSVSSIGLCDKPEGDQEMKSNSSNETPLSDEVKNLTGSTFQSSVHFEECQVPDKEGFDVRKGGNSITDHSNVDLFHAYKNNETGFKNHFTQKGPEKMKIAAPIVNGVTHLTDEAHSLVNLMTSPERSPPFSDQITTHESPRHPVNHLVSLDVTSGSVVPESGGRLVVADLSSPAPSQFKHETNDETHETYGKNGIENVSSQQQSHNFELRQRQSMYDFLIHGFNRPFLSNGLFAGQEIHNITTVTDKERPESDATNSERE